MRLGYLQGRMAAAPWLQLGLLSQGQHTSANKGDAAWTKAMPGLNAVIQRNEPVLSVSSGHMAVSVVVLHDITAWPDLSLPGLLFILPCWPASIVQAC